MGGDALRRLYGKLIQDDRTGEALEIVLHSRAGKPRRHGRAPAAIDRPLRRGAHRPRKRGAAPAAAQAAGGQTSLSVQVHPNDGYAMAHEHKLGKTEAWVILAAGRAPGSATA